MQQHPPTRQQQTIIETSVGQGDILLLNAYAGTGKTTTLEMIARANPKTRFLYFCFNRDNAREAKQRFPRNCKCCTTHSMAWRAVGRTFTHQGNIRPRMVMDEFGIGRPFVAVYIIDTLNTFLHSTDREIGKAHLAVAPTTKADVKGQVLSVAKKLWAKMQDRENETIPMSHDGYLKLWAMSDPEIGGVDVIFLDEAQDTNPCVLGAVMQQVEAGRVGLIAVGDTHQSIYRWRHAVDAMDRLAPVATSRLSLTESFRFGAGIAHDASVILTELKNDPVQLQGVGGQGNGGPMDYAVISRTNARLIGEAVEKADAGMRVNFSATSAEKDWDPFIPYKFQMTMDIFHLWDGKPKLVRDPYMKKFRSFAEVQEHAGGEGEEGFGRDVELACQVDLVLEHERQIPRLLDLLRSQSCAPEEARLTFTTSHRSKGREWDCVHLLDDIIDPGDEILMDKVDEEVLVEEFNILYVAATRAKRKIMYPRHLHDWLVEKDGIGQKWEHRLEPKEVC